MNKGKIIQVIGSVLDAAFEPQNAPAIYNALEIPADFGKGQQTLIAEVQQHLGGGHVRAVSLGSTLGLRRGMEVIDTGQPLMVPVGKETLGRVFNLLGEPIDEKGPVKTAQKKPIHREPPLLTELQPRTEMFETGHKSYRPALSVCPWRKNRPFRRGRRRKDSRRPGAYRKNRNKARRILRLCRSR